MLKRALLVLAISLWMINVNTFIILAGCFGIYLATGGWRFMQIFFLTAPRDFRTFLLVFKVVARAKRMLRRKTTIDEFFDATVIKNPNKVCFLFKDETWRFGEFQAYTNRVANFLREKGLGKGDVVAVFSENCPEMVAMWLAMSRLGVTAALINFNLRDVSLTHCINISDAKAVIFGVNLQKAVADVVPNLPKDTLFLSLGKDPVTSLSATNIDQEVEKFSDLPPPKIEIDPLDTLFYIYTSGTTGLPKAAKFTHFRFFSIVTALKYTARLRPDDVLYTSLPLYHSAGGALGVGQCLLYGLTVALRDKFSASQFWDDCIKYRATASQYIGEICRYLVAQPPKPEDRQHSVRVIYGNGLKPQIWKTFQERFQVKEIVEFYGSTEGTCNSVNTENVVGAVGFISRIVPALFPMTIVKVDPLTGSYVRDSRGLCVKCQPGEQGEMVGKISTKDPMRRFDGYVNKQETSKKVIHDVFAKGDMAFASGDILVMDELGFLFFCDRTGDTFRWKGENVSTSEVEAIVSNHISFNDAVVYGVEVPGCEGRAGMVAMVAPDVSSEDVKSMGDNWCRSLPSYSRPVFVRILPCVDTTGTFKLMKTKLRNEGFSLDKVDDPVYFLDPVSRSYKPLDQVTYDKILDGSLRL